jgi:hypothetical protein
MSTKIHHTGHGAGDAPFHRDVTFEPRDINVATVAKQLIYLGITIALSLVVCVPILRVLTNVAAEGDTPMAPVRAQMSEADRAKYSLPPEPRLQGVPGHGMDAQQDLRDKIAADTEANESIGWVDKANGIAKIPVQDAMKIIAEKAGAPQSGGGSTHGKKPAQESKK